MMQFSHSLSSSIWLKFFAQYCVIPENIYTPPPRKGSDFPGGGGGQFA